MASVRQIKLLKELIKLLNFLKNMSDEKMLKKIISGTEKQCESTCAKIALSACLTVVLTGAGLIVYAIAQTFVMAQISAQRFAWSASSPLILATVYFALLCVTWRFSRNRERLTNENPQFWKTSLACAVLAIATGTLIPKIFEATGSALRSANQAELAKQMSNPSLTVATVALATVLAPLFEECIFRLIPFSCFAWLTEESKLAKTIMLIATSAFFACMHVSPVVNSWLVYFAVGMIFGIAYLKGGFVCSSLAHFSYNMFAVLMSVNLTH